MKVIVDTSVWSIALRKVDYNKNNPYVKELSALINEGRVQMIGPNGRSFYQGSNLLNNLKSLRKQYHISRIIR